MKLGEIKVNILLGDETKKQIRLIVREEIAAHKEQQIKSDEIGQAAIKGINELQRRQQARSPLVI